MNTHLSVECRDDPGKSENVVRQKSPKNKEQGVFLRVNLSILLELNSNIIYKIKSGIEIQSRS